MLFYLFIYLVIMFMMLRVNIMPYLKVASYDIRLP